jgi:hypothetical protein
MFMESNFQPDSIVQAVIQRFVDRAKFGHEKYGTDLDRKDLTMVEWLQHAQDELHDGILYLEKIKQTLAEFSKVTNI